MKRLKRFAIWSNGFYLFMPVLRFATWSNGFYLFMPVLLWPFGGWDWAIAASSVGLCVGSGWFHYQGHKGGIGHYLDEVMMIVFLISLMGKVFDVVGVPEWVGWIPPVLFLFPALLLVVPGARQWLSSDAWLARSENYVKVLAAPTLVALTVLVALGSLSFWPVLVVLVVVGIAVLVRGDEDHEFRHGMWHLLIALAMTFLMYVLPN